MMSGLHEVLRSNDTSKFCWSGRFAFPYANLQPPIAEPIVLVRSGHASIVMAIGALNQWAMLKTALLVKREAQRPEVRIVYLLLGCLGGRLGAMSTAARELHEAGRHAAVVAYLHEVAYGPALWLAYQCGLVFANPVTQIGWIECASEDGETDCDATIGMVNDLAILNPRVSRSTWARLIRSGVTGEAAEATGIISDGGLKRSVFELSGIDPDRWPVT